MRLFALIERLQEVAKKAGDIEVETPCGEVTRVDEYNKDGTCAWAHSENGPVIGVLLQ